MQVINKDELKILTPSTGCKLCEINGNVIDGAVILGKYDSIDNYKEVVATPNVETIDTIKVAKKEFTVRKGYEHLAQYDLNVAKNLLVESSKDVLENYLVENSMYSTIKHRKGRYYTVTMEKQNQLNGVLISCILDKIIGSEGTIYWNDEGSLQEEWTFEEIYQLKKQIDDYVQPLVKLQQQAEININKSNKLTDAIEVLIAFKKNIMNNKK